MSYTLAAAAKATGLNKRTILLAIKGGKITATRDELGKWHVESAELHRVYPAVDGRSTGSDAAQESAAPEQAAALGTQIDAIIKRAEERLKQQLDGLRRDQHAEHDWAAAEAATKRRVCELLERAARGEMEEKLIRTRTENPPKGRQAGVDHARFLGLSTSSPFPR